MNKAMLRGASKRLSRERLRGYDEATLRMLLGEHRYRANRMEGADFYLSRCGMIRAELRRRSAA